MGATLVTMAQMTMDVNTKKLGAPVQSTMYGIFFEDINYAADGGLYGELVKNRSFEFPQHLMGWQAFGCVDVKDDGPFQRCPHYVELSDPGHRDRRTGLTNEGYFGIGVKKGEQYRFSVWAKAPKNRATIRVQLIDENSMDRRRCLRRTMHSSSFARLTIRPQPNCCANWLRAMRICSRTLTCGSSNWIIKW